MYISVLDSNNRNGTLFNLETANKVVVRCVEGQWEIGVFYRDDRRVYPKCESDRDEWAGYDVIAYGSEEKCRELLDKIIKRIRDRQPITTIQKENNS